MASMESKGPAGVAFIRPEHDNQITNFHFEISGDLLDEEQLTVFEKMRPGLIQLEIGPAPCGIRGQRNRENFQNLHRAVRRSDPGADGCFQQI